MQPPTHLPTHPTKDEREAGMCYWQTLKLIDEAEELAEDSPASYARYLSSLYKLDWEEFYSSDQEADDRVIRSDLNTLDSYRKERWILMDTNLMLSKIIGLRTNATWVENEHGGFEPANFAADKALESEWLLFMMSN